MASPRAHELPGQGSPWRFTCLLLSHLVSQGAGRSSYFYHPPFSCYAGRATSRDCTALLPRWVLAVAPKYLQRN